MDASLVLITAFAHWLQDGGPNVGASEPTSEKLHQGELSTMRPISVIPMFPLCLG